jgi:hypothetical protein
MRRLRSLFTPRGDPLSERRPALDPQCHRRADCRTTVEHLRQRRAIHAQLGRRFAHLQGECGQDVVAAGSNAYGYDANGQMTSRNGSTTVYTSYNLPRPIAAGAGSSTLCYGVSRNRYKQIASSGT